MIPYFSTLFYVFGLHIPFPFYPFLGVITCVSVGFFLCVCVFLDCLRMVSREFFFFYTWQSSGFNPKLLTFKNEAQGCKGPWIVQGIESKIAVSKPGALYAVLYLLSSSLDSVLTNSLCSRYILLLYSLLNY